MYSSAPPRPNKNVEPTELRFWAVLNPWHNGGRWTAFLLTPFMGTVPCVPPHPTLPSSLPRPSRVFWFFFKLFFLTILKKKEALRGQLSLSECKKNWAVNSQQQQQSNIKQRNEGAEPSPPHRDGPKALHGQSVPERKQGGFPPWRRCEPLPARLLGCWGGALSTCSGGAMQGGLRVAAVHSVLICALRCRSAARPLLRRRVEEIAADVEGEDEQAAVQVHHHLLLGWHTEL